jgi:metal-responsive CopG/Arc/MetJ family transcriptional regulator
MCYNGIRMAQITLRVPDDLLDRIDAATDEETSRSEWLRNAARERLDQEASVDERLGEIEDRLDEIDGRVAAVEEEQQRPLYQRLFG